jgi:small conductance mechanosensitive channel
VDVTAEAQSAIAWLQDHAFGLVFWGVILVVVYRFAKPAMHRLLLRVIRPPTVGGEVVLEGEVEVEKRVATLEDLFAKIIRFAVVVAVFVILLSLFDAWSVIAGLGILVAALTLAGQSIVLDYLSGILLLVEGPYFKGDTVIVGGIEGTVEEVGLRRTVLRDVQGTVHSVANGEIRIASNETRMYGTAVVDLGGIGVGDVERTIEAMNRVGAELADDEEWSGRLLETPHYAATTAFTNSGATLRMVCRVRPAERANLNAELRRRLAGALADAGVEIQAGRVLERA